MKSETPQIETLYRQVRGDHERRVTEAERRLHHTGGRPLRPGLRQVFHTMASWLAAVVRPRTTNTEPGDWASLGRGEHTMGPRPRPEALR